MNRATQVSIAALTFVLALGVGLVAPSGADHLRVNLNPNHCQGDLPNVDAGHPTVTDTCIFTAAPGDQELWLRVDSGTATVTVACNGNPPDATLNGPSGLYDLDFVISGGTCVLELVGTDSAEAWTWPEDD